MQTVLASLSNIISLYLAYVLYFVLEDFCIVCVSMYAINLTNCFLTLRRYDLVEATAIESTQAATTTTTKKDNWRWGVGFFFWLNIWPWVPTLYISISFISDIHRYIHRNQNNDYTMQTEFAEISLRFTKCAQFCSMEWRWINV